MPPLTEEQFNKAKAAGFTVEQIIEFEKKRLAEEMPTAKPQSQNIVGLPKRQQVETAIAQRPDSVARFKEELGTRWNPVEHPFKAYFQPATTLMKLAAIPFQRLEAGVANPALQAQAGNFNLMDLARSSIQGLGGQRSPELGDIVRTTGFGGRLNEPISGLTGLVGSGALAGGATKATQALAPKIGQIARGAGKVASAPVRFVQNVTKNIKNVKNPVQFSQNVRRVLFQTKKGVGDAFEQGIQQLSQTNPSKSVDLSDAFQFIKSAVDDVENNPGLASEIKGALRKVRNPELAQNIQGLIDDPKLARNLTLAQSQEIKNTIQQATSIANKMKQGGFAEWKQGDLELLDLVDEIKLAQSESFPEMAKIREPYAKYMGAYREVKNYFKPKQLLDKIRKGFGNEEVDQMIKVVLPEDIYKAIRGFRRTSRAIKWGAGVAATGAGLAGGNAALKKLGITDR